MRLVFDSSTENAANRTRKVVEALYAAAVVDAAVEEGSGRDAGWVEFDLKEGCIEEDVVQAVSNVGFAVEVA